jgi:hypothetical protein
LNLICYTLDREVALRREFDDLRDLARGKSAIVPTDLLYGGIGEVPADVDGLPAEHRVCVRAGSAGVQVCVTLFEFCGLTFARHLPGLPVLERVVVMDAAEKRIVVKESARGRGAGRG